MTIPNIRHLIFNKGAENAAHFYQKLFEGLQNNNLACDCENAFTLAGIKFYCTDIPDNHECSSEKKKTGFLKLDSQEELTRIFHLLSRGGKVIVPITEDDSGIFAWVKDALGLSWQLNYCPRQ